MSQQTNDGGILGFAAEILAQSKGEIEAAGLTVKRYQTALLAWYERNAGKAEHVNLTSFRNALQAAIDDALLPDGKQALINCYKMQAGRDDEWIKAEYQRTAAGVVHMAMRSGRVTSVRSAIVKENDDFEWTQGDEESIVHRPRLGSRGETIGAYAIITFDDGRVKREVMGIDELNAVKEVALKRVYNKNQSPWNGPFEGEMQRKTVIRRGLKYEELDERQERAFARENLDFSDTTAPDPSGFTPSDPAPPLEDQSQDPADAPAPARIEPRTGTRSRAKDKLRKAAGIPEPEPEPEDEPDGPMDPEPPPPGDGELPI